MIWTPQRDEGKGKSLALAAAVHVALIVALFVGVQWKSRPPESVEVELWQNTPGAHPAPEPPPPPPPQVKPEPKPEPKVEPKPEPKPVAKPDIAVKDEKKKPEPPKKEEPKKPEPLRPSFDDELKRDLRQIDQQRRMQQQTARADAETRALSEARNEQAAAARNKGLADYSAKIRGKIRGNTVLPPGLQGNPEAVFEVTQLPSGEVIAVRKTKSSGNPALDAAFERAILKSSPLPRPDSPDLFQRVLEIKQRPFDDQ